MALNYTGGIDLGPDLAIPEGMICVISGTSRDGSNGLKVARHVAGIYEELGETVELLDLSGLPDGSFSESVFKEKPADLEAAYTDKVLASDGVVVVVPEYNGSYPGILKHFIDLLPFPESFECRPVAFIGIAGGYYGGLRAVEQLQMVFAYRNAYLFNRRVFIPSAYSLFDEAGEIKDDDLKDRLKLQSTKFIAFSKALKGLEG
ncbi:MAG: NADPH-dependent FMN reductase [Puniceicoccaceae bacterium]